ncbi:MAG: hydrogenase iron-sulfur subunit [Pseudomonadota bacterium]
MVDFEPIIIGFLCNWCSYEAADSAGRARKEFPANLRIIRLMCSGRIDPQFLLEAFKRGADGVLILGCQPSNCHYKEGNLQVLKRYVLLKRLLQQLGIDGDRVRLDWVSAKDAQRFVNIVSEMVDKVRSLGPIFRNPQAQDL